MKTLIFFLVVVVIASCSSRTENKSIAYEAELKIKEVVYYGDTIRFDPPQALKLTPNSDEIVKIALGNGADFGVKFYVSEMTTGSETELLHNVVFFNKVGDSWNNLGDIDHREKLTLNEEKDWTIGAGNDTEQYLKVYFSYKVTEHLKERKPMVVYIFNTYIK